MSISSIISVYNLASVADRVDGQNWYLNAYVLAESLADKYFVSVEKAAGVIAALSPRNKWKRNIADAENILKAYSVDPESIDAVKVSTFHKNKAKAIRILSDSQTREEVLAILSGPKLREFFNCILDDSSDVCIDGHAYSIWFGDRITLQNVPTIGIKLRARIKDDYKTAAAICNISPAVMQAVTWCTWRRLHGVK